MAAGTAVGRRAPAGLPPAPSPRTVRARLTWRPVAAIPGTCRRTLDGYCTLPLQQSCQYANACLTCPVFVTTAEFLPEHRRQLEATRSLIARAAERGQERVAEMNRTVETNLLNIIGALSAPDGCTAGCSTTGGRGGAGHAREEDGHAR